VRQRCRARPLRGARARVLTAGLLALSAAAARADELKPFEASYNWVWHGLTVAASGLKLEKGGDDIWTYTAKSDPRGIGRAFSERPRQVSVVKVTPPVVQPQTYKADDGTGSSKRTIDLKYDWESHRVTGVYEQTAVNLPLTPEVQDDASIQLALMVELLAGRTPEQFSLIDKNSVREYRYAREGEATLQTPLGPVHTIVYRAQKAYSPRVTRFWCAPERGYVPMKVEQTKGSEVQWTMQIQSLTRN
jgi:uncharacterized protein DUF3108